MRFALLGDPVGHSLSPAMHRAAFELWGVEASYETRRVAGRELEEAMRAVEGGNVTLPHKLRAAALLDSASWAVRATRACNCFRRGAGGSLEGENTDVAGLAAALAEAGLDPSGARVLLLGAGGAARAAAFALASEGARAIELWNRTAGRARRLVQALALEPLRARSSPPSGAYDLVVNATSLGLDPSDPLPLDLADVRVSGAYDLVYGPGGTPWTRRARELGIPAEDGLGMLVHQAALSLRFWMPDRSPPIEAMREAARAALEGRGAGTDAETRSGRGAPGAGQA